MTQSLRMYLSVALNSESSHLHCLNPGITGVCHQTCLPHWVFSMDFHVHTVKYKWAYVICVNILHICKYTSYYITHIHVKRLIKINVSLALSSALQCDSATLCSLHSVCGLESSLSSQALVLPTLEKGCIVFHRIDCLITFWTSHLRKYFWGDLKR